MVGWVGLPGAVGDGDECCERTVSWQRAVAGDVRRRSVERTWVKAGLGCVVVGEEEAYMRYIAAFVKC